MARIRDMLGTGTPPGQAQAIAGTSGQVTGTGTGSQGAGVILSFGNNDLVTAASLDTFVLPTAAQGAMVGDVIYATTETATSAVVYPGGTNTCNGSASAVTVAVHKTVMFVRSSATNWGYFVTA